jgi:ribonucleoside-triphosphate reductase
MLMVREFKLSESFIDIYKTKEVLWGPMGEFTYLRTYSRRIDEEGGRNEKWFETVRRVVEGCFTIQKKHCDSLQLLWNNSKAQKSAQIMYEKIFNFKFLPPGRGLWMMGTSFVEEKGSSALMNCAFVSTEDIETRGSFAFTWAMDALMLGVGVGFDVRGANKLSVKQPKPDGVFQIPDSREGWVESLKLTLDAFIEGKPLPTYDASLVRPYGSPIKGFGGVASGPEPLLSMLESIKKLLETRVGQKLRSTDIVDIMNFIGVCVVAGNVRRSAESCLGNWRDTEYVTMKDHRLYGAELSSHRWASNNSILAEVGKTDYTQFAESIALNGEPGIVWMENIHKYGRLGDDPDYKDSRAMGLNPCFEQILESLEMCNLVETFPSLHESYDEYEDTLKYAYLYAKTVTLIPTHWAESNAIMLKNRRIGLSQSGIIEAFTRHGRRTILGWNEKGYQYIQKLDTQYSDWLCIPRSKRTTSIKPSGTVSLLPGVTPGIHYPHSEYYIRRIRCPNNNPLVKIMREAGYKVHKEAYGKTDEDKEKTVVIDFPIHEAYYTKGKADASIWEQVKNTVDYQRTWADNSVSVTVTFKKEEVKDIPVILHSYEDVLKAISFLPLEDTGYDLMPYETTTKEKYEEMAAKITKPDFSSIFVSGGGEKYCDSDKCLI